MCTRVTAVARLLPVGPPGRRRLGLCALGQSTAPAGEPTVVTLGGTCLAVDSRAGRGVATGSTEATTDASTEVQAESPTEADQILVTP